VILGVRGEGYSPRALLRLERHCRANRDLYPPFTQRRGICSVGAFGSRSPKTERHADLYATMAADGVGADLRIALTVRGRTWGGISLLREHGARSFSADDIGHAEQLSASLAAALRRFVASIPMNPAGRSVPGTVILNRADHITAATEAGRGWLRDLGDHPMHHAAALLGPVAAARTGTSPEIAVVPTCHGWATIHAHPLDGDWSGDVAVTMQPASSSDLFSVMAVFRGITAREQTIIEHALNGLSTRQIARQVGLSPHTVGDHFKAIRRKMGVTSRFGSSLSASA